MRTFTAPRNFLVASMAIVCLALASFTLAQQVKPPTPSQYSVSGTIHYTYPTGPNGTTTTITTRFAIALDNAMTSRRLKVYMEKNLYDQRPYYLVYDQQWELFNAFFVHPTNNNQTSFVCTADDVASGQVLIKLYDIINGVTNTASTSYTGKAIHFSPEHKRVIPANVFVSSDTSMVFGALHAQHKISSSSSKDNSISRIGYFCEDKGHPLMIKQFIGPVQTVQTIMQFNIETFSDTVTSDDFNLLVVDNYKQCVHRN